VALNALLIRLKPLDADQLNPHNKTLDPMVPQRTINLLVLIQTPLDRQLSASAEPQDFNRPWMDAVVKSAPEQARVSAHLLTRSIKCVPVLLDTHL